MNFNLRKYDNLAICTITEGNTEIDLGMLNIKEATALLEEFKAAVNQLEWFLNKE